MPAKKLKTYIGIVFLFCSLSIHAQSNFQLEANLLVGGQDQKLLNQRPLTNSRYLGFRIGGNWQLPVYRNWYIETGLFGKIIYGTYETELANFNSEAITFQVPVLIGLKTSTRWENSAGLTVESNRDFEDMNVNLPHNLRLYASIKSAFKIKKNCLLSLSGNFILSKTPDSYTITNPANYISFGLVFNLTKQAVSIEKS